MEDGRNICLYQFGSAKNAAFLDVVIAIDVHWKLSATEALQ